jgi:UDP-N-acetylmuramoyl-L-alanyl-D-glutamate--2,6-diaminopimelate ligase
VRKSEKNGENINLLREDFSSMKLSSLIRHIPCVQLAGQTDPDIADIQFDSRKAGKGTLFVCVPGLRTDGHLYAREAVSRGAAALLVERPVDIAGTDAAVIQVSDIRNVMARLAVAFYGDPTRELKVIGVTGTNGKTTTTRMAISRRRRRIRRRNRSTFSGTCV